MTKSRGDKYDPNRITPISYPVAVCCVRRSDGGTRYIDIRDAEDVIISVAYSDRTPGAHFTSMRTAQAVCDALNHCRINICTDGSIGPTISHEAPVEGVRDASYWKSRAQTAERQLAWMQKSTHREAGE